MAKRAARPTPSFRTQDDARADKALPDVLTSVPEPVDTWPRSLGLGRWQLPQVLDIRAEQAVGRLRNAAKLARSLKTDGAIYSALLNRIAPHRGLPREIVKASASGHAARPNGLVDQVAAECDELYGNSGTMLSPEFLADVNETIAVHGLAVAQNVPLARADGSRVDLRLEMFPTELLEWIEPERTLYAWTMDGRVPVIHGDGRWVVFAQHELEPWTWGALMALSLIWADRAFSIRDRAKSSESQGDSKWLGELPEGISISSTQGQAFKAELAKLYQARRVMVRPNGSKVERSEAMARNWEIFKEIIQSNNLDASKVLIGQEPTQDSSQRLSAAQLFGVRNDIVEGDLRTMERAINTGTIRPWQLLNFGRSDLVVGIHWLIPDADEDARREAIAKRWDAFNKHCAELRENGFVVDQALADSIARAYGLEPPQLKTGKLSTADVTETNLKYGVLTLNEARDAYDLPAIDGGDETIPQTAKEAALGTPVDVPAGSPPELPEEEQEAP